ncbi:MAG: two-component regulator propeller domain-containing protein [Ginsengibacter sp.]
MPRYYRLLLWICFLLLDFSYSETLFCQKNEELVLHKIDEQNGLSDNNVHCIYKDKNDFVWIGTASGLNLMDGSDITVYKHEPGNPNSIAHNNIAALTSDNKGLLWIGTTGGVNSFDPIHDKFSWFPLKGKDLENQQVTSLIADDSNNIYMGTFEGLFFLDVRSGEMKKITIPGKKYVAADNAVNHLVEDHSGKIWIATYNGLWSYDKKINAFTHEVNEKNDPAFGALFLYSIIDHEGNIWMGTWDKGLKELDPKSKKLSTFKVNNNQEITSIAEVKQPDGNYLIWINGGFNAFDPLNKKMVTLPVAPAFSRISEINYLYASTDNWLWIGTHQGFYFYNPGKSLFLQHRFSKQITPQLVTLLQWKNQILVSGTGSNFLKAYDSNFHEIADYSKPINNRDISCLCLKFSGNNFIKAGTSKGIADIDLLNHKIKFNHLDSLAKKFSAGNFITSILKDKNQNWWIFPWRFGIWRMDSSAKNLHRVFYNFITQNGHPKPLVIADAIEDKNGNIWMADLDEGIIFYNSKTKTFSKPFKNTLGEKISMSQVLYYHNNCYSFAGPQAYKWDPENLHLQKIINDAQNDRTILSMAIDSSGNLWMATKKGLLFYDVRHKIFDRFTTADGLISNELDVTMICTSAGRIVMGSPDYLSSFDPKKLLSSIDQTPKILLTSVKANGRSVPPDSIGKMNFGYRENNFVFKWTVTDYNNPLNNHFYYRLKGIDQTWRAAGNHGRVEFANLSPGKYTLLLKGENSNGVSADKTLSANFTILLPFWRTWWFLSLLFLAIAAFFYWLYRYRLAQALKIEKLRNKISLDLHDDIGSTLSSISILSEMALHEKKGGKAGEMLQEIKENSLSLMERMDDIVWSINPQNDSLESLFLRIKTFASRLFEAKEINYNIAIDEKIKHEQLQMEHRQYIYLILKEAINNLVKYSCCSYAEIKVEHAGSHLNILIKDNGEGFEIQKSSTGNGLNSIKQRAREMHGTLKINSKRREGTTIFLSVKIK